MRDRMRQEMLEDPQLYEKVQILEEDDTEFAQAVFRRLIQTVVGTPLVDFQTVEDSGGDEYTQEDIEYLFSYRETVMKKLEIRNRRSYMARKVRLSENGAS